MLSTLFLLALALQSGQLPPRATEWFEKGQDLIGTEKAFTEEQAGYFERVLELAPDFAPAHYNLALIYRRLEQMDRAVRHADRLVEIEPDEERGYKLRAHLRQQQGALDDAVVADLKRVVEIVPQDYQAWGDLTRIRYQREEFTEALKSGRHVLEHSPSPGQVLLTIALCQHALGQMEEAIDSYRRYLALQPDDFTAHFNLGLIYRDQEADAKALEHFLAAEELQPDNARLSQELGELYLDQGDPEAARLRLERVPQDSAVQLSNLGVVATQQDRLREAEKYFQAALSIEPENALIWGHLADVQMRLDRQAEALNSYQKALRYNPQDLDSMLNLGALLANLNEPDEAVSILRRALEQHPESGEAAFRLAVVLERVKRWEDALRLYQQALERGITQPRLHFRLAVLYSRQRAPEPALKHLEEAFAGDAETFVPIVMEQLRAVRSDLDSIRYRPEFQQLLKRYRPGG